LDGLERWDFFTKAESAQLLAAARSPKERLLLMFALHTGALAGEQLALWATSTSAAT
jgi:hypothetical protein